MLGNDADSLQGGSGLQHGVVSISLSLSLSLSLTLSHTFTFSRSSLYLYLYLPLPSLRGVPLHRTNVQVGIEAKESKLANFYDYYYFLLVMRLSLGPILKRYTYLFTRSENVEY